jgi:hypothetical protein
LPWTGGPPAAFAEEGPHGKEGQQEGKEGQQEGKEGQQEGKEGQQEGKEGQQEGKEGQPAQAGGATTTEGSHAEHGRAFFRPHVHRELSEPLLNT